MRYSKNFGIGLLIPIYKLILLQFHMDRDKIDIAIDKAFISNLIPQMELLSSISLEVISSFIEGNIMRYFNEKISEENTLLYVQELRKYLQFNKLNDDKINGILKEYKKKNPLAETNGFPVQGESDLIISKFQKSLEDLIKLNSYI